MGKNSRQAASRYAAQSTKKKKGQSQKPTPENENDLTAMRPRQPLAAQTESVKQTQSKAVIEQSKVDHAYLISDLKRTGIITVGLLVILIALSFVL